MFKEVAKPLSRYALDDFGCQKDAHALITEVGARRKQEAGGHGAADELGQGCVSTAQLGVFRKHVGEPGGVCEQVADTSVFSVLTFKLG